jgi:hypothetical protein
MVNVRARGVKKFSIFNTRSLANTTIASRRRKSGASRAWAAFGPMAASGREGGKERPGARPWLGKNRRRRSRRPQAEQPQIIVYTCIFRATPNWRGGCSGLSE